MGPNDASGGRWANYYEPIAQVSTGGTPMKNDRTMTVRNANRPNGTLDGVSADQIECAIDGGEPLVGTCGFAGRIRHERRGAVLVRDVLGRRPLFSEREADDPTEQRAWAFDRTALSDPVSVPAGFVRSADGDERVWKLPDPSPVDGSRVLERLETAIKDRCKSLDSTGTAVGFSGGIDSALVASGVPEAPCYVAGFPGAHDIEAAREAADAMGRTLTVVELTHERLEAAIPPVVRATGRSNPMDVAIALPLYLTAREASADGYDRLALGQGADELFGGYSKHVHPADDHRVAAETVRSAVRETILSLPNQLERDVLAVRSAGVEPVTPYLCDAVVSAALELPESLLVEGQERKVALRRIADGSLPDRVVNAEKKALQYGSYVSRELDRLARQAGFKRRIDDHVGNYIRSIVADPDEDTVDR